MQNSAVIRLIKGRLAWCPQGGDDELHFLDEQSSREQLHLAASQPGMTLYFAASGADVALHQLEISAQEKKHIEKSLPFMLEESLVADVEALHFASGMQGQSTLTAAVCARSKMDEWKTLLADLPGIKYWIPEPLLLPWREGEWTLVIEDQAAIVRTGSFAGFTIELELLASVLEAILGECADAPQTIVIYGRDQTCDSGYIPEEIRGRVQWRRGDLGAALLLGQVHLSSFNLLQGDFAVRLPLARWWQQWRAVAAVIAVAFCMQLAATYAEFSSLERENMALRLAVEQSYRKAYPRGAVVDAEKQLKRQLGILRGSSEVSGFVNLMHRVGEIIVRHPGTTIASVNYNDKGDEIRMNITASDFAVVDNIRTALVRAGLSAKMESSSAQGDQVRARLRIGTGS